MQFIVRDRYHCSVAQFWGGVFFDDAYNQALYREGLGFESIKVLSQTEDATGERHRRIAVKPKLEIPRAVKSLLGDALTYVEEGRFDAENRRFYSKIVPSKMVGNIKIRVTMWMEPLGDDACDRVAEFEVKVTAFGVGRVVEKFVERVLRESYAKSAKFTNQWLSRAD